MRIGIVRPEGAQVAWRSQSAGVRALFGLAGHVLARGLLRRSRTSVVQREQDVDVGRFSAGRRARAPKRKAERQWWRSATSDSCADPPVPCVHIVEPACEVVPEAARGPERIEDVPKPSSRGSFLSAAQQIVVPGAEARLSSTDGVAGSAAIKGDGRDEKKKEETSSERCASMLAVPQKTA